MTSRGSAPGLGVTVPRVSVGWAMVTPRIVARKLSVLRCLLPLQPRQRRLRLGYLAGDRGAEVHDSEHSRHQQGLGDVMCRQVLGDAMREEEVEGDGRGRADDGRRPETELQHHGQAHAANPALKEGAQEDVLEPSRYTR